MCGYEYYSTTATETELPVKLKPNQSIVGTRLEYRYTIGYQGYDNDVDIWEEDLKAINVGTTFYNNNPYINNKFKISKISYHTALEKRKKPNGKYKKSINRYGVWVEATYKETQWSLTKKTCRNFPEIKAIGYNGGIETMMSPCTIIKEEVRKIWVVSTVNNTTNNQNKPSTGNTTNNQNKPSTGNSSDISNAINNTSNIINNALSEFKDIVENASNKQQPINTTTTPSGSPTPNKTVTNNNTNNNNTSTGTTVIDRSDLSDNARKLYIRNIYKRVLGREPSNEEINSHFKNSSQKTATDIIFSTESNNKNKINSMTNSQFIDKCYNYILGRTADEGGKSQWLKYLSNGNSRQSVVNEFIASKEFKNTANIDTSILTFNDKTCTAVYESLRNDGYSLIKPTSTTILMYTKDIEKVQTLNLSGKGITDLNGLNVFKNLKKLSLANNKIQDLSKISTLTNLEELVLNNNSIKNLKGVESLTKLSKLILNNNQITDVSSIEKLTKLSVVNLNNNQLTNLGALKSLSSLKEIYADNNNIKSTPAFNSVNKLSMKNNKVNLNTTNGEVNVTELLALVKNKNSKLYTENNLVCSNCKIDNNKIILDNETATITVKGGNADGSTVTIKNQTAIINVNDSVLADKLKKEFNLEEIKQNNGKYTLFITNEAISSKKAIDLSSRINDTNKITDITGLEKISQLTSINLRNNNVSDFTPLSKINTLQTLDVQNNGITNFSTLKNLKQLKQLDASQNNITDINGIENLTKLQDLILSNNNIGNNIQLISKLQELSTVSLTNNGITDISGLANLKTENLYLDRNGIVDLSMIKKENVENLSIENNNVVISVKGTEIEIPAIVKKAIENNGGVGNLECTGCSIKNNKLYFDEGIKLAKIKIKAGELCDTIITIQDEEVITPPNLKCEYYLAPNKMFVDIRIVADKKISVLPGWYRVGNDGKAIGTTIHYNVKDQLVTVSDLYGNESSIMLNFNNVEDPYIPGLTINYSNSSLTNKDVTVTFSANEELSETTNFGWEHVNGDVKTLSKTFSENVPNGKISIMTDKLYRPVLFSYTVSNIDKKAPVCEVEYSTTDVVKGAVKATIWSDEEIESVNVTEKANATKVVKMDENGNKKYGIVLYYTKNANDVVTVRDMAYNVSLVKVDINNIDEKVDGLYSKLESTTQGAKVTIGANENINVLGVDGNKIIAGLPKVKNVNEDNVIMVANSAILDSVGFAYNKPLYILAQETEQNEQQEVEIDFTESELGVFVVEDNAKNKDLVLVNTSVIDKDEIYVAREDTINDDGSVTVTLKTNKPIMLTEKLTGWEIGEDFKTLTQNFKYNTTVDVELEDSTGNVLLYNVKVDTFKELEYGVLLQPIEGTDQVLVVIHADTELQEIDGWKLSEDKKQLGKIMGVNENKTVVIYDINGRSAEVDIKTMDEEEKEFNNENTDESKDVIDNTQSNVSIPQTGQYVLFAFVSSLILIVITSYVLFKNGKE